MRIRGKWGREATFKFWLTRVIQIHLAIWFYQINGNMTAHVARIRAQAKSERAGRNKLVLALKDFYLLRYALPEALIH